MDNNKQIQKVSKLSLEKCEDSKLIKFEGFKYMAKIELFAK